MYEGVAGGCLIGQFSRSQSTPEASCIFSAQVSNSHIVYIHSDRLVIIRVIILWDERGDIFNIGTTSSVNRPDYRGGYLVKVKCSSRPYCLESVGSFLQPVLEEYTR